MMNCNGCKNRNSWRCSECVGWNRYESNTLMNPQLGMDIDKELKMLADYTIKNVFGDKKEKETDMKIKKVIFNAPATVVLWEDGTKTIVKAGDDDIYDPEKGLAMAIAKKALGNQGNYYEVFKKWLPEEEEEEELSIITGLKQKLSNLTIPKLPIATDVKVTKKDEGVVITGKLVTLLTAEELAEKLGCTKATIQKQCRKGLHPGAKKVSGKWKIPYTE